jgi:hypothetical protein
MAGFYDVAIHWYSKSLILSNTNKLMLYLITVFNSINAIQENNK